MKIRCFLILFTLLSITLSAQVKHNGKITGTVITKDNNPVPFAEIILIALDSTAIKSELTDEKGNFLLESEFGKYKLQVRQAKKIAISISIEFNSDLDIGNLTVDNVIQLESVIVGGRKKLIERKVDRLVFNVENSINAAGGDAFEALKVTPGIRVQNDIISMIGKSTLAVMIDEKIVTLSGEDLTNYLKSIPSDAIKSVEVITNPPAKYEAAGNSGLVNIILKKGKKDSWNALIGATYLQRKYSDGSLMGNFNYNKDRLSISALGNYKNGTQYINRDDYSYFSDGLWQSNSPIKVDYSRINVKFGIDYQVSSRWTVGSQFLINNNKPTGTDSPTTTVYDYTRGDIIRSLKSNGETVRSPNIKSANLYNEFKIDTIGKKIILNFDYFNFNNIDTRKYKGISIIENPYSSEYFGGINSNNQDITNVSGKLDVDYPLKWGTFNFGGKVSNSKTNNDILAFNSVLVDVPVSDMPLLQNEFEYTENVQAVYISGNKKFNDHWESQLGLRMESTQTKSFTHSVDLLVKDNYVKFFPTAYLSYVLNDNSTFTFGYSKRIDRPRFSDLNPNIWYTNIFQTMEGNPFLQPAFIDNTEFTYTYKKLESKFYFSNEENLFSPIAIPDPNTNIIRSTIVNYVNTQRFGIAENYVFDKFKWWTSNNSIDVNYALSKSSLATTVKEQKGFNSRVSTNNDFILNSNKTLLFNLSYWYSFPGIDGIYNNKSMSSFSLAIQYLLLNRDLKISLKGDDIFRNEIQYINSTVNNIYQESRYYFDRQSFQLSLSYKFGNKKIRGIQRETGNQEERSRTGN